MTPVLFWALKGALFLLAVAMLCALARLLLGPSAQDRVMALVFGENVQHLPGRRSEVDLAQFRADGSVHEPAHPLVVEDSDSIRKEARGE